MVIKNTALDDFCGHIKIYKAIRLKWFRIFECDGWAFDAHFFRNSMANLKKKVYLYKNYTNTKTSIAYIVTAKLINEGRCMNQDIFEVISYASLEKLFKFKPSSVTGFLKRYSNSASDAFKDLQNSKTLMKEFELDLEVIDSVLTEATVAIEKLAPKTTFLVKDKSSQYPQHLALIKNAPHVLYVMGNVAALQNPGISIVGSRTASLDGQMRAQKLAKLVGEVGIPVISGLALGIDSAAHSGALMLGLHTTAVIGTPINKYYPKENVRLQNNIAERGTLVSQFSPLATVKPLNFPLRNEVMSGLSFATVIVEAGETSGALTQAKFAISQKRILYIMKNQIDKPNLSWPRKFLDLGGKALENVDALLADIKGLSLESESAPKPSKQLSMI